MKDVLEYSDDELKSMSDEDLKVLLKQAENLESLFNVSQLVQKTLINSLYGALGNTYFPLFNEDMAAAITGNGRYFIQKAANTVEAGLQKILPSDDPYIIYGDTDSVLGDTLVKTSNGDVKIEDLYDRVDGKLDILGQDNFVKHTNMDITAASVSPEKELQYKPIKYVMKHKVKKRMFKITCKGESVTVTEDHSIIIIRDNELLSVKPKDIVKTDKIIKIS